jgi:hypothetical protein
MKKTILTLVAGFALSVSASAQNFAFYEGINSTTDISGTTISVQATNQVYEGFFFVKNLTGTPTEVKIRRVSIVTPPAGLTEQVCSGPLPDPNAIGNCFDIDANTPNWVTPVSFVLDNDNKANMEIHVDHHGSTGLLHNRYYVEDMNGNKLDSIDVKVGNIASVKENKATANFSVYPNPVDDVLTISIQSTSTDNAIRIVDVLGNLIVDEKMSSTKKLDVSNFKNGVYILTVYSNGSLVQTKRIVVRH